MTLTTDNALDLAFEVQRAIIESYEDRTPEQVRERIRGIIMGWIAARKQGAADRHFRETILEPARRLAAALCKHEQVFNRTCLICRLHLDEPARGPECGA